MKKFGYKTSMQVPRIKKITLNMGVGETTTDKKILDNAVADLTKIAGQKPWSPKQEIDRDVQGRKGFPVGCMVTLRGQRMYEFWMLVTVAIPRIRDFRASRAGIRRRGNYSLGSRSRSSFRKSNTTRSTPCEVTSASPHREKRRRGARAARRFPLSVQD